MITVIIILGALVALVSIDSADPLESIPVEAGD